MSSGQAAPGASDGLERAIALEPGARLPSVTVAGRTGQRLNARGDDRREEGTWVA